MKILIGVPCTDYIDSRHYESAVRFALRNGGKYEMDVLVNSGALIYASRDYIAAMAVNSGADAVLWFDSDVTFEPDILDKLVADKKDCVTGLYFRRRPPYSPVIYSKIVLGMGEDKVSETYEDYPQDKLFEVDACGMGGCLTSTAMLKKIFDENGTCFAPYKTYGEDISFGIRARKLGYKLWCDSRIKMGHVAYNIVTDSTWSAVKDKQNVSRDKESITDNHNVI